MRSKIFVHPGFQCLERQIKLITESFDSINETLYSDRNVVKLVEVSGMKLVVKSYRRIYLPNRIRYRYFFSSKAERAFFHAVHLMKLGFNTPYPVAYVERFKNLLLSESYFISLYSNFTPLNKAYIEFEDKMLKDLAMFSFRLHQQGIYHVDYSCGNIMLKWDGTQYLFSLVDNNRMRFGSLDFRERLKNFSRLALPDDQFRILIEAYARLSALDEQKALHYAFLFRHKRRSAFKLKRRLKAIIKI